MSTATATAPAAGAATPNPLRFTAGARERFDGVFYDETRNATTTSVVMPEAKVPVGNWLKYVDMLVTVSSTGNAAAVALQADAPWTIIGELTFIDAGGNTVDSLRGYNVYLMNLFGGFMFQTDPATSPFHTALTTGAGATAGSGQFILRLPVEIIDRDAIGAYPNGASNAAVRMGITLNPLLSTYSTVPNGTVAVNIKLISVGYVTPAVGSPGGRPYADAPNGAGSFQQWTQVAYDLSVGARTFDHTRKGNVYRQLILVARTTAGVRSDTVLTDLAFMVDEIASVRGPWAYLKHITWQRNLVLAANLPAGVVQVSYCHDWDGKTGGELRDGYVPTQPGSKVQIATTVGTACTLEVITNEIVTSARQGVLRV